MTNGIAKDGSPVVAQSIAHMRENAKRTPMANRD
jgi:hypothetical protein